MLRRSVLVAKPAVKFDVLYSENSHDDFVVLCTLPNYNDVRNDILDEFRKRAYKRCFKSDSCLKRVFLSVNVALFKPRTDARTPQQRVDLNRLFRQPYCQMMHFKTTWESETIGIKIEDKSAINKFLGMNSRQKCEFFSHQEIHEDIVKEGEYRDFEKDLDAGAASSGYGTKSTGSGLTRKENREAESHSDIQTMISGEEVTGQDLLREVKRAVLLRMTVMDGGKSSDVAHDKVRDWLMSSETRSEIPDILTTEDLDRKLGNVCEAEIGLEGGKISLRSYGINFPPNAVKTKTKFKFRISLETDLLEYPEDLILVCLPLHCSPGNLEFYPPVTLKIPTWIRKADSSPESPPISVHTYQKRKDGDWLCVKTTELNSSGLVEVECDHFCINAAFIKKSDVGRVKFALEHVLFKDNIGTYTSCHFLASDAFVSSMLQYLKENYEIVHPPTYTSLVREGDEVEIDIVSRDPENYRFESLDRRVLKIDKDFYTMNRRESITFLLTLKKTSLHLVEFIYSIGEKQFLRRDILYLSKPDEEKYKKELQQMPGSTNATGLNVERGGNITIQGDVVVEATGRGTSSEKSAK